MAWKRWTYAAQCKQGLYYFGHLESPINLDVTLTHTIYHCWRPAVSWLNLKSQHSRMDCPPVQLKSYVEIQNQTFLTRHCKNVAKKALICFILYVNKMKQVKACWLLLPAYRVPRTFEGESAITRVVNHSANWLATAKHVHLFVCQII